MRVVVGNITDTPLSALDRVYEAAEEFKNFAFPAGIDLISVCFNKAAGNVRFVFRPPVGQYKAIAAEAAETARHFNVKHRVFMARDGQSVVTFIAPADESGFLFIVPVAKALIKNREAIKAGVKAAVAQKQGEAAAPTAVPAVAVPSAPSIPAAVVPAQAVAPVAPATAGFFPRGRDRYGTVRPLPAIGPDDLGAYSRAYLYGKKGFGNFQYPL